MTTTQIERDLETGRAVGAKIHQMLWEQRITQTRTAELLGIGRSTLSKKLRGAVPITVDELMTIARLLGQEPGDLLPRLDSNQQPSGYEHRLVSAEWYPCRCGDRHPDGVPCDQEFDTVVDLGAWRLRVVA